MLEEDILTEAPPIFLAEILRAVCTSTRHRGRVNPTGYKRKKENDRDSEKRMRKRESTHVFFQPTKDEIPKGGR